MKIKFKNLDKYTKLAIVVILIGILLRFSLAAIYHVSGDACWHFSAGRFIAENGKIPLHDGLGRDEPFWAPPLFHFFVAFVFNFFNAFSNEVANSSIKFVSPVFGSLTLIFSYLIFRKLFDEKISFYAILFLTFIPIHIDYSVFGYVEATLTFFVVLSFYFALENRAFLSAISAGLAILTKYNGIFVLPLLIYIFYYKNRKNKKIMLKKLDQIAFLPLLSALPWFIRNYTALGNPIWPFLNFIFSGFEKAAFSGFDISRLYDINLLIFTWLGIFGVPDGNPKNIFFINLPFLNALFLLWLLATIIFMFPLFFGFAFKKPVRRIFSLWILSYFILMLLYVANVGFAVSRMFLPAIPALGVIWAMGLQIIAKKFKSKIFKPLIILIIFGFIFAGAAKLMLASNLWDSYKDDFEFVKENTGKNDVFLAGGQCITYNINRETLYPGINNLGKADYAFVNQNFGLDRKTVISSEFLEKIKAKGKIVYRNENTKTEIYKLKQ